MGRDERFREMQAKRSQSALGQAQERMPASLAAPVDRLGKPILPGALVIYRPPFDLIFQVADVRPILDPLAPPGMVQVLLFVQTPVNVRGSVNGRPNFLPNFVVVGQAASAEETPPPAEPSDPPATEPLHGLRDDGLGVTSGPDDGYRGQPRDEPPADPPPSSVVLTDV